MKYATALNLGVILCRTAVRQRAINPVLVTIVQHRQASSATRTIHTTQPKAQDVLISQNSHGPSGARPVEVARPATPVLAVLPLSQVLRTFLITSVSSSPRLLGASSLLLRRMLESKSPFFRLDRNPLMRMLLWETFYKQFCAGETLVQVRTSCDQLKKQGYGGVILEYALEVLKDAEGTNEVEDVAVWRKGMLASVDMAAEGDFVGLKWSGMGPAAMKLLKQNQEPNSDMSEAMMALCTAAAKKDVALLPAAEESWTLEGVNQWSLDMQRIYNLNGKSVVYNTYQAYLKQTPAILSRHLELARQQGFTLGVKLVRGAYLGSEERSMIHDTINETHEAYDSISAALLRRQYNAVVQPAAGVESETWPAVNVVLATHNAASVEKAQALRLAQAAKGEALTPLAFAQLQGMADEVSHSLIAAARAGVGDEKAVVERVLKCTTWGSMHECLNYLLRRAAENKDAAGRTAGTRNAMGAELWRRSKAAVGLA